MKLTLNDVKLQKEPYAPYADGLTKAMIEAAKKVDECADENWVDLKIKVFRFELTEGAKEYIDENKADIVKGHNKYVYMSQVFFKIKGMYTEGNILRIGIE